VSDFADRTDSRPLASWFSGVFELRFSIKLDMKQFKQTAEICISRAKKNSLRGGAGREFVFKLSLVVCYFWPMVAMIC